MESIENVFPVLTWNTSVHNLHRWSMLAWQRLLSDKRLTQFWLRLTAVEITLKQVDDSVAAQIYPLQQQLYAIRKAALENLVTAKILESEAAARGISIEELRRQLTLGEINVTRAQVEEAYTQNASFFASMSPDEARESLRLDLENQARMKHYRAGLEALRKKWAVNLNFAAPQFVSELDDGVSPAKGSSKPLGDDCGVL